MAASKLYVPDPCEGIKPQQVDGAGGEDKANIQESMKSNTTSEQTMQTGNIEKKMKKKKKKKNKKRTRASLDAMEEEEILKTKQVQIGDSSTPLVGVVVDLNKSNIKSSSGIYMGQFDVADKNEKKIKKEETELVKEEEEEKETLPVQFVQNEKNMKKEEPTVLVKEEEGEEGETLPVQSVDIEVTNESKSRISGVLLSGLRDYFRSQGFDHRWAEEQDLEDMESKWKAYKIAEAKSDLARAHFLKAFNTCALKAYRLFGYQNDS